MVEEGTGEEPVDADRECTKRFGKPAIIRSQLFLVPRLRTAESDRSSLSLTLAFAKITEEARPDDMCGA